LLAQLHSHAERRNEKHVKLFETPDALP